MAIDWTKLWSASDNGTTIGGSDLRTIQTDIDAGFEEALSDALAVALPSQPGNADKMLTTDGSDISWGWEALDEDDMSSNSAVSLATQQSIVAYVATQLATISTEIETGSFTRDMTAVTATVPYAGVTTFTPRLLLLFGVVGATAGVSLGWTSGASKNTCISVNDANPNTWTPLTARCINIYASASALQHGVLNSFDATGFTIDWTKVASPTGTATFMWAAIGD